MSIERAGCSTARISVTVTDFHEIREKGGCSRADVELIDTAHGKVSQARINAPIVVSAEVYLDFFVSTQEDEGFTYSLVGVSFKEVADIAPREMINDRCGEGDPLGHAAFPMRTFVSRGSTTQLTLFDANPEPAEFKFDLVIQRSDGLLGLIDPGIRNSGVMK
jgi:hypothetical protein